MNLTDVAYLLYPTIPLRILFSLARAHGRLLYLTRRTVRDAVRKNLRDAVETSGVVGDVEKMTRRFFEYRQLRTLLLTLAHRLPDGELARLFPIEGEERLDEALAEGRGTVLIGSHVNSICAFMAVHALSRHGYDVRAALPTPTMPYDRSPFRKAIDRLLRSDGSWMRDSSFYAQFDVRPILRALGENAVVLLMGDGWHSASFVEVELLGRRVHLTSGPIAVARGAGAPILPLFTVGEPPDRLRFLIEPRLETPESSGDGSQLTESTVREYARRLDIHVRGNLSCWQHLQEEDALRRMENLLDGSLADRYKF